MAGDILSDEQIRAIAPSRFYSPGLRNPEIDEEVRNLLSSVYCPSVADGMGPYDQNRQLTALSYLVPLFRRLKIAGKHLTALEVGCGNGIKCAALSSLFGTYVGLDLEKDLLVQAEKLRQSVGAKNLHFVQADAAEVSRGPRVYGLDKIPDVLLLIAVLEHLTRPEQLAVFELAKEVVAEGGTLVVIETPNRLIRFDSHSSQLHFFQSLPEQVALDYASYSPRPDWRERIISAPDSERTKRLHRQGSSMSFHEFELYLFHGTSAGADIIADGYNPELLNLEPFTLPELDLLRYFDQAELPNHRGFTRCWIDLIVKKDAPKKGQTAFLAPFGVIESAVHRPAYPFALKEYIASGTNEGPLYFEFSSGQPALQRATLLFNLANSTGSFLIQSTDGKELFSADVEELKAARTPIWHSSCAVEVDLSSANADGVEIHTLGNADRVACEGMLYQRI